MLPKRGQIYTAAEVLELEWPYAPCFQIPGHGTIQDGPLTPEDLLSVPGFSDTKWRYSHFVDDLTPIFHCVTIPQVLELVNEEDYLDSDGTLIYGEKWITPKGFPLDQSCLSESTSDEDEFVDGDWNEGEGHGQL